MGFVVVKVALVQFYFQVRWCSPINNIPHTFTCSFLYRHCKPKKIRTEWQIDETRDFLYMCATILGLCVTVEGLAAVCIY